jgi:uncharacterized protein YacL
MIIFGLGGVYIGVTNMEEMPIDPSRPLLTPIALTLLGVLFGLIATPWITTHPARALRRLFAAVPAAQLVAATIGLVVGLLIAALAAFPLSRLPDPFGQVMPVLSAIVFGYIGVMVMTTRQPEIFGLLGERNPFFRRGEEAHKDHSEEGGSILLDTSVIIDGRIADISQTGFLRGTLLVPRFVLNELQHIADSPDVLRRNRGRRGLDILNRLQKESRVPVHVTDLDAPEVREVDDKLVVLAKKLHYQVLTNDYNLNRVAELQGVQVLNINELANAVRAILLPGETMSVQVIQEGKELGQGVGYLDDGTMVVVEEGRRYLDRTVDVVVTKVLQTAAGRMIFARPEDLAREPRY